MLHSKKSKLTGRFEELINRKSIPFCLEWFAKPLEVHDLPLPQEADDVVDVRIVGKTQNVVISEAGFLFCCNGVRTAFLEAVIFIVQAAFK